MSEAICKLDSLFFYICFHEKKYLLQPFCFSVDQKQWHKTSNYQVKPELLLK